MFGANFRFDPGVLAATDYPAGKHGPERERLPTIYRQWAAIAWQDLVSHVPDEADSPEIADAAGEQFRGAVGELLAAVEPLSYSHDAGERTEVQRRSLIDWCRIFSKGKPGPWKSVRSLAIWCREGEKGLPEIALHQKLAAQVRRGQLLPYTQRRFGQLCELYGVGICGRTNRARFVELDSAFVAEQLAGPGDGKCDGDGDADCIHAGAGAYDASRSPSHFPSRAAVVCNADPPAEKDS